MSGSTDGESAPITSATRPMIARSELSRACRQNLRGVDLSDESAYLGVDTGHRH
jgi:hypothetical protein